MEPMTTTGSEVIYGEDRLVSKTQKTFQANQLKNYSNGKGLDC